MCYKTAVTVIIYEVLNTKSDSNLFYYQFCNVENIWALQP